MRSFASYWEQWSKVESLLVVYMLYHSGSISDAHSYLKLPLEQLKNQSSVEQEEITYLMEEF